MLYHDISVLSKATSFFVQVKCRIFFSASHLMRLVAASDAENKLN